MTESPSDTSPPPSEPGDTAAPRPRRAAATAIALAATLVLLVVVVATAPFWAPALSPLLPWGTAPARPDLTLAERINRLEAVRNEDRQNAARAADAQERAAKAAAAAQQTAAQNTTALQQVERRVAELEARPILPAGDIADLRQQLAKLATTVADLAARSAALEKTVQGQEAADSTDHALLLALLHIRDAVATARPFATEYDAFAALARARPEIADAARPLAEPAGTGVASRAVLAQRLQQLAGQIAGAEAPPTETDVGAGVLARLRGLVTIRRIDGPGQSGSEAAATAAERSLAAGDLEAAVAALDKLTGAPADVARPWLDMARQRLAVETALRRVETLLAARLGTPSAQPADAAGH